MIRIYIRRKNEIAGHVFICKESIRKDEVAMLPFFGFVNEGIITEEEWAKSQELIADKFELFINESYIDGRCKVARNMKKFSWKTALKMKYKDVFKPMGYKTICNAFGMEIEVSNCGSMVRYRIGDNKVKVSDWTEIHFTTDGEPYFKDASNNRHYLSEFMKY